MRHRESVLHDASILHVFLIATCHSSEPTPSEPAAAPEEDAPDGSEQASSPSKDVPLLSPVASPPPPQTHQQQTADGTESRTISLLVSEKSALSAQLAGLQDELDRLSTRNDELETELATAKETTSALEQSEKHRKELQTQRDADKKDRERIEAAEQEAREKAASLVIAHHLPRNLLHG
jgi:TolA-binding protein